MDNPLLHNALGSATAGIISRICTHPLDTAKARIQAPASDQCTRTTTGLKVTMKGPIDALVKTFRAEGAIGLYRGFGAIVVGGTPGTMIYLCSYEHFKNVLARGEEGGRSISELEHFSIHFLSGLFAETLACLVYVPVDVIKERLQVQTVGMTDGDIRNARKSSTFYRGSFDALQKVTRKEGISGIYKGYGATLASFGPFSALYFVLYEKLKVLAKSIDSQYGSCSANRTDGDMSFGILLMCSAVSGAVASWLTSPLDMAKLRLQIQRGARAHGSCSEPLHSGMVDCLRSSYSKGGLSGLFRGAGARVLHFVPATTITMTFYEKCRSFYAKILSTEDL